MEIGQKRCKKPVKLQTSLEAIPMLLVMSLVLIATAILMLIISVEVSESTEKL